MLSRRAAPAALRGLPPLIKTSEYTLRRAFGSFDRVGEGADEATYLAALMGAVTFGRPDPS